MYRRSDNGGESWSEVTKLVEFAPKNTLFCPNITAGTDSKVHLVYRAGNEVYYKCSTDRGVSWGPDLRLTFDPDNSDNPSIAVSGSRLHVVWHDDRVPHQGTPEVYYKSNESRNLQTEPSSGRHLARETWYGNQNIHLVMKGKNGSESDKVYYCKTMDGGVSWSGLEYLGDGTYPTIGLVELPLDVWPPWYAVCVAFKPLTPNNQLIYKFFNPSLGSWSQDYTLTTQPDPGPPSLVQDYYGMTYVGYSCGDGHVYSHRFPYNSPGGTPVEIDPNNVCSQVSLGMDAYGRPHASWRRGTGSAGRIWYSWRDVGGWTAPWPLPYNEESQQPFVEGFSEYVFLPWSKGSGNGSEIIRGRKNIDPPYTWTFIPVTSNSKASESPVWALNEFATYSEGTTGYNDIYYWRESSGNSSVVESNPNEYSYWPHSVAWSGWFWDEHLAVAWTERETPTSGPYRVLTKHFTPSYGGGGGEGLGPESAEHGGYYKVVAGQDAPSPYCRKRDGVMRFGDKAVDYAKDSLVYELPYLDPKYDFLVKVSSYRETGNDWVQALSVDGKAARTLRLAPNKVDTAWVQIPPELYLKDRKVVFSLKKVKGDYVTSIGLGLYYYDHKKRGKGGGPQAGEPVALPVREVFAVYPNPAKGQAQIEYSLRAPGQVDLSVYDLTGRLVKKVVDASQVAGVYKATWDGRDLGGRAVSSGVYFLKLTSPGKAKTARVVLVR